MGGKAAILLVLGFSTIFLVFGFNFNNLTLRAVDNLSEYYIATNAQNIAASGANIAANKIFIDPTWTAGYNNIPFSGGSYSISVDILDPVRNVRRVTSVGNYGSTSKTIQVILQPTKFSQFAYFCQIEGNIWWTSKDTVWGPFHTQDWMQVQGHPMFYGKATTKKGMKYYTNEASDIPQFLGGYEKGINLDLPDDKVKDFEAFADDNGAKFEASSGIQTYTERYWNNRNRRWETRTRTRMTTVDDFYITFKGDSLSYKEESTGAETTVLAQDFAPNGIIYAKDANLHISGTVKGQYTVAAYGPSSGLGRVYLEDDITYYTDPRTNPNSTDLLGIIARNEVLIADNANNRHDINIDASIYSEKEGFGAENHDGRSVDGNINLYGGIIQKKRQAVGTFSTDRWGRTTSVSGFNKRYKYDERLMFMAPPEFPATDSYQIVSWYE